MGSLYQHSYSYEPGVSYPIQPIRYESIPDYDYSTPNKLYSDSLQSLAQSAQTNKVRVKQNLLKHDLASARKIITWRTEDGFKGKSPSLPDYPHSAERPKWDAPDSVFTTSDNVHCSGHGNHSSSKKVKISQDGVVNQFCYLCTTLEEHQQHIAKRGVQLKAKEKPKVRIQYIAPPPMVKITQKEVEEKAEVLYKFSIKTGHFANAGTSANVTVKLKGTRGILRKKTLKKKTSAQFTFGRGTTETFYVKGPRIGDVLMLAVEHDGMEQRHAWYLEEIEVTNVNTDQTCVFICKNWLSLYHGDFELKKVLKAEIKELEPRDLEVTVVTGDKAFAGTDSNVFITVYGRNGVSHKLPLKNRSKDNFEKGNQDKFLVTIKEDIGKISKIRLEHDNSGAGPGWLVEKVAIVDESTGQNLSFPCGRWLATDEDDGMTHRDLFPVGKGGRLTEQDFDETDGKKSKATMRYEVTVLTGKLRYAGTDARVYMTLFGKGGRSSEFELVDKSKDLFEQGQTDVFKISTDDVGDLKRIRVRHDNSGLGAGWYVEKISIKRYFSAREVKERLRIIGADMDEAIAERASQITGSDVESSPKNYRKGRKHSKVVETESDDDDDDDTPSIFGNKKKPVTRKDGIKKKKNLKNEDSDDSQSRLRQKYKNRFLNGSDDEEQLEMHGRNKKNRHGRGKGKYNSDDEFDNDSEDDFSKKGKKGKKMSDTETDSDDDSDSDSLKKRSRKNKIMKWISHAGYRIQVTDDEAERKEKKKNNEKKAKSKSRYRNKFEAKYPTDSSSSEHSSEVDTRISSKKRNLKKKKKSASSGGKYISDDDSEDELRHTKYGHSNKSKKKYNQRNRKVNESDSDDSISDKIDLRRGSRGKTSSVWKKDRIPYFDEYVFECHKWMAKDEGDGLFDREFKASTVTTFHKMNK